MQGCLPFVYVCFYACVCTCVYSTCAYVHSITICIPQVLYSLEKGVSLSCNLLGLKATEPSINLSPLLPSHCWNCKCLLLWLVLKYRFWDRILVFILSIQTICKLRYLLSLRVFSKSPKNVSCPWKQNSLRVGAFLFLLSYEEIVYLHDLQSSNSWCCQQTLAFISMPFVETYEREMHTDCKHKAGLPSCTFWLD